MNKKILIISYYWFPSGGTGVYRVSKFVKYLKRMGWEPVILTTETAEGHFEEKEADPEYRGIKVIRVPSWEPISLFRKFTGGRHGRHINPSVFLDKNRGWKVRLSSWVRLNFFIPDAKVFWKNPAIKAGAQLIREENPVAIFSTSPPPTAHLVAKSLAEKFRLPWLADFRDPWTRIFYYDQMKMNPFSKKYNEKLEASVMESADAVTVVNHGFFPHITTPKMVKIENGFDPDDRKYLTSNQRNDRFSIRYFGNFKANQFCGNFFDALENLSEINGISSNLRFEVHGFIDQTVRERLESNRLNIEWKVLPFIPKQEALRKMSESDLLMMVIGRGRLAKTGLSTKLFDYMLAKKPVLAFGPVDGAAAQVLHSTKTGKMFNFEDVKPVESFILKHYLEWENGGTAYRPDYQEMERYNFEGLTRKLDKELKKIIQ